MPEIRPFRGLIYNTEETWNKLCCPPYDVVSENAQTALEALSPHNAIRLERPLDSYDAAANRLSQWRDSGVLRADDKPAYYVLEMEFSALGRRFSLRGFTARLTLSPFSEGKVLPHEETLSKAKADRLALSKAAGCQFSAIYGLYDDSTGTARGVIDTVVSRPADIEFTMPDGVTHRQWSVKDAASQDALTSALKDRQVYIADGHHRYETALGYSSEGGPEHIMISLFDMSEPGLVVLPTHRTVSGCGQQAADRLLNCGLFDISDANSKTEPDNGSFVFYYKGGYKLFTLKEEMKLPGMSAAYCGLDVAVLHSMVLEPFFGVDKAAMVAQSRLTYTRDASEAAEQAGADGTSCAFILPPTKVSQIRDVSLAGEKMPQKSTFFYPKLITGMVFNDFSL